MKKKAEVTTDKALIFSAVMIIIFTIVMIVIFCMYQTVPDSLIVAFYGFFGLEGGYCAFVHKTKKELKNCINDIGEEICTNAIGFHVEEDSDELDS